MAVPYMKQEADYAAPLMMPGESCCNRLCDGEEDEVLTFLAARPIHTVYLAGLIRDHGLVSPYNRGAFFGSRNHSGQLDGVALIGHATIVEARTDEALAAFADATRQSGKPQIIRGERKVVDSFWKYYADEGEQPRRICRELMLVRTNNSIDAQPVPELRQATVADLDYVVAVNAAMAFEERGVNPLKSDPAGFRQRAERRIQQGRVWIGIHEGKPIFKADVIGDTPEMIYLEGIHVHPEERLKGYGKRCLIHLSSILLKHSQSICLTLNQRKANAVAFYFKAGFDFHSEYQTFYLQ
jgi:predicted GNAT family acetyltransferase